LDSKAGTKNVGWHDSSFIFVKNTYGIGGSYDTNTSVGTGFVPDRNPQWIISTVLSGVRHKLGVWGFGVRLERDDLAATGNHYRC
jgi:hypothetical protein